MQFSKLQLLFLLFLLLGVGFTLRCAAADSEVGQKCIVLKQKRPIQEQFIKDSTIYVIRRKHNLNGGTLVLPNGSTLVFEKRGKLANGFVIGNRSVIRAPKRSIFDNVIIDSKGTWCTNVSYPEWFGACNKPSFDSKMAIQKAIDVADTCVLSQKYYTSYDTPTGRGDDVKVCAIAVKNKCIKGMPGNKLYVDAKFSNTERTSVFWVGDNVTIDGVNIEYLNEDHSGWTGVQAGVYRVQGGNVKIENTMLRGAMAAWINLIGQAGRENFTIRNNFVHDCDCGLIIQGDSHTPGEIYPIKLLMENNVIEKEKERHSEFVSFWGKCNGDGVVYYTNVVIRNNRFVGGYKGGCISGHPQRTGLKNVVVERNEYFDCGGCSFSNADSLVYVNNHVMHSSFIKRQVSQIMGSYPHLEFYNCSNCLIDDVSCFGLIVKNCSDLKIGRIKQTLCLDYDDPFLQKQPDYFTNFVGINAVNSNISIDNLIINPFKDEQTSTDICKYFVYNGRNSKISIKTLLSTIPIYITKNEFLINDLNLVERGKKLSYINTVKTK